MIPISIRAPFQSTPSAWRETDSSQTPESVIPNFNPLPPQGGRPISARSSIEPCRFQSTPSAWRETCCCVSQLAHRQISIHSLRMEGDLLSRIYFDALAISIHSLRMEGDVSQLRKWKILLLFQSTPSAWRETTMPAHSRVRNMISIHSLRMEGDASY